MALIHRLDQVTPDVIALQCHACQTRYSGSELDDILCLEDLRCPDSDCGLSGMVPLRASRVEDRYPEPLADGYTPMTNAFWRHAGTLKIEPHGRLLILVLESHRRAMGDEVWPSRKTLAELTGLSEWQVKSTLKKLVSRGYISRRQPRSISSGRHATNRYMLDPLWLAVADLERASTAGAPPPAVDPEGTSRKAPPPPGGTTAGAPPPADRGCYSSRTAGAAPPAEEDVREEDPPKEEDPVGTSPALPELATLVSSSTNDDVEQKRYHDFVEWKAAHMPKASVGTAWPVFSEREGVRA